MEGFIFLLIALFSVWIAINPFSWESAMREVKRRHESGNTACGMEKRWYGWRVKDYPECRM